LPAQILGIPTPLPAAPAPATPDEGKEIAVNTYVYSKPLMLMEVTRKVHCNTETGTARPLYTNTTHI